MATRILLISCLLLFACSKEKENNKNLNTTDSEVYNDVFYATIDSLFQSNNSINNKTLVLYDFFDKDLKRTTIDKAVMSLRNDSSSQAEVVRRLSKIINDSISIASEPKSKTYKLITDSEEASKVFLNDSTVFLFNLSKVAYVEENRGCFYFGIHCGKNCSSGNLIFVKRNNQSGWKIIGISELWTAN